MDRLKFLASVLLLTACSMFFYQLGVSAGYRASHSHPESTDLPDRETAMEEMAREMLAQMRAGTSDDSADAAATAHSAAAAPASTPSPIYVGSPALAQISEPPPACPTKP